MKLDPKWEYVTDGVMGGVSQGSARASTKDGREVIHLTGQVSLDNNGGFLQVAFDLKDDGSPFDASDWSGIALSVKGNDEMYDLRLRTDQLARPWQSFRTDFRAPRDWTTIRLPFDSFEAHKIDAVFDPSRLRRMGVLAIGREFEADIHVASVSLYK